MKNNRGITLTELIIATSIVGIIMLGAVASDLAIRQAEQTYTSGGLVSMQVNTAMAWVMKSAGYATGRGDGSGPNDDPGVVIQDITTDNTNFFCFRQDFDLGGLALNTPIDYSDDRWVCFTRQGNDFVSCRFDAADGPTFCGDAGTDSLETLSGITSTCLSVTNPNFTIDATEGTQQIYFEFTLISRVDPAAAADRLNNPEFQKTSRVYPPSHTIQ